MNAFDVLHDPVRRRLIELLAEGGEQAAGDVGAIVQKEFGISQPTVSQHLRVLRESGFASMRQAGTRRLYLVDPEPLRELDEWLSRYRKLWEGRLDKLGEVLDERHPGINPDNVRRIR
jgi:DNA-binding transcriptional ArsR family regulator